MLVIKTWCLPAGQSEGGLRILHKTIVNVVVSVPELGLKDQNDMVCLFPSDLMKYGLGEEIVIEVTDISEKPKYTKKAFQELKENIREAVSGLYPNARVFV
jgi:hypothetical protein